MADKKEVARLRLGHLLNVITDFSDAEYQERVWRRDLGSEVSSYDEDMCIFFDDMQADSLIDEDWKILGLTKAQASALRRMRDALNAFDAKMPQTRPRSTPEVLDHPDWPKVREIAKDTLRYFRNKTLFSA